MRGGRPFRFLAVTLGGWTMVRAALLWPTIDSVPALIRAIAPPAAAESFFARAPVRTGDAKTVVADRTASVKKLAVVEQPGFVAATPDIAVPSAPDLQVAADATPIQPPPQRPTPLATAPARLAGSIWGIARNGSGGALPGGQLGGSQAGFRLTYALGEARRVALAARVSSPLRGRGREMALGVDWQPTALPLHIIAEQRIALDGGKGGPALMVIGGVDPVPVALGFRLGAYGPAGAIARDRIEPFVDGAARLTKPVATIGQARIDLGVGSWGGAQRGAARLDVGPSAALVVPVAERTVRMTLDWRQRISGDARPGSGPALTIGSDF
ncbi:hypothetical protein ASG67_16025 [Sphingomonas sp. Leaf339]|uniref:hypothetical protein n=1 Tax=Sphingomonas sp. Leaf339 TaxID=1736343 RepID=UPI00070174C7|nr:hypothetical protein [Sphingomonas sp. Leaf339]KQU45175.1 hypothetical protein ASG67_16025 [Sphingomonas sp. Leaf339]